MDRRQLQDTGRTSRMLEDAITYAMDIDNDTPFVIIYKNAHIHHLVDLVYKIIREDVPTDIEPLFDGKDRIMFQFKGEQIADMMFYSFQYDDVVIDYNNIRIRGIDKGRIFVDHVVYEKLMSPWLDKWLETIDKDEIHSKDEVVR